VIGSAITVGVIAGTAALFYMALHGGLQ